MAANEGGSIFANPKTGIGSNPFAVRSSPGRLNSDQNDQNSSSSTSSIIAPSKFGASASSSAAATTTTSTNATATNNNTNTSFSTSPSSVPPTNSSSTPSTSHSVKDIRDAAAECNGSSSKPLLRPSLIGSQSSSTHSSILKPATLVSSNPFSRAVDVSGDESPTTLQPSGLRRNSTADAEPSSSSSSKQPFLLPSRLNHVAAGGLSPTAPASAAEDGEAGGSEMKIPVLSNSEAPIPPAVSNLSTANLFSTAVTSGSSSAACNNFVFGQKLHERVANPNHAASESTSNGTPTTDNLFGVIPKEKSEAESATSNGLSTIKTLSDSARELEEARAAKRKYDEVTVVTGEEDEQNALQVYGKLFTFDKAQGTWVERGRGTLRLNDKQMENQTLQSRLVMRTQGCLRVILNTKVWAEMTIDKTSSKSIRLTAVDGDQIRVFLLMASLKDTETLFNALEWRLAPLRAQQSRAAAIPAVASSSVSSLTECASSASGESVEDVHEVCSTASPKRRSTDPEEPDEAKKKRSE
nr:EOG090X078K [Eurycercus lamellatus]